MCTATIPDVEATEALGAALAHEVRKGDVIFLRGELGAGKTSLARGFLRRFFGNRTLDAPSPSYLLHFVYCGNSSTFKLDDSSEGKTTSTVAEAGGKALVPGCNVHHIDPYRLPEGKIASLVDFEQVFQDVALIEWPERLGEQLVTQDRPQRLEVQFEGYGPQAAGRTVVISAVGDRWKDVVQSWAEDGGPLRKGPSDPWPCGDSVGDGHGDSHDDAAGDASSASGVVTSAPLRESGPAPASAERPLPEGARNYQALPEDPLQWLVLGIESSCDDTGAAVVRGTGEVLGEALASQAHIHEKWGGVVPRLAQEAHREAINSTVEEALRRAGVAEKSLSAVAVTVGPGLGLCLEVGVRKALQVAARHRLPLVRVHHMEAHMLVTRLPMASAVTGSALKAPPAFPFLTLLVSGGHNMAVLSRGIGNHTILGSTIDDSIGEAFDKTARILGITQVPGGPHLERLAKEGDSSVHKLPKPLSKTHDPALQHGCDYSFSGLKTAVKTLVDKQLLSSQPPDDASSTASAEAAAAAAAVRRQKCADIAAAFQSVAVQHLCDRASRAAEWAVEMEPALASLVVAGGVAANQQVRAGLGQVAEAAGLQLSCPPPRLCVDNGVMVAWTGLERLRLGLFEEPPSEAAAERSVEIRPRWPLGQRDPRSSQQKLPRGQKRKQPAATPATAAAGAPAQRPRTAQGPPSPLQDKVEGSTVVQPT